MTPKCPFHSANAAPPPALDLSNLPPRIAALPQRRGYPVPWFDKLRDCVRLQSKDVIQEGDMQWGAQISITVGPNGPTDQQKKRARAALQTVHARWHPVPRHYIGISVRTLNQGLHYHTFGRPRPRP
jgi:hypothetical protein